MDFDRAAQDEVHSFADLIGRHQRHARGKGLARKQSSHRQKVVGRQIAEQSDVQITQINVGFRLSVHTSSSNRYSRIASLTLTFLRCSPQRRRLPPTMA